VAREDGRERLDHGHPVIGEAELARQNFRLVFKL
jgi:hypothetical protein